MSGTTRWLIVLQPNQQALYEVLRRSIKEESPVRVIYDRRTLERRRGSDAQRSDRRRTDRRQRRPSGWLFESETVRIVEAAVATPARPAPRPEGDAAVTIRSCPECGLEVEFEMPRFPQPPARLEIETIHVGDRGTGLQHFVEIHAFTASGRPLLSQRNQAWRRGASR